MPLDDLVSVIGTLQQRIATHRQSLQQNETRTRTALIDPLLTALGWDVSDPALVTPEYNVGNGRADYALNGSEAIPAAIVEAKRLGHALSDDERMQMLNYANARGVRCAAVTDSDVWEFYEVFKQAPLEDRRLLSLRIANTPAHELALQLLLLWRPNLASGQPTTASRPLVPPSAESMHTGSTASDPTSPVMEGAVPSGDGWVKLGEHKVPPKTPAPTAIRFPGGIQHPTRAWREVLTRSVEWLVSEGTLNASNLPVPAGRGKRNLVNSQPIHQDRRPFKQPYQIPGKDVFVFTQLNVPQTLDYTRQLLQHCGIDPATVHLQVAE